MLGLSGLSSIITWASICASHIQFRRAWKLQGHTLEELPWASPIGVYGSYYGLGFNILVLIAQFYKAAWPIVGETEPTSSERVVNFFQSYLAFPIVIVCYIAHKLWAKTKVIKVSEIDITTGRRDIIPLDVLRREREEAAQAPLGKKIWRMLF